MSKRKAAALAAVLVCSLLAAGVPAARAQQEDYEADFTGLMAPGGYLVLFYNSSAPLSYVGNNLRDLPAGAVQMGKVHSIVCEYGLSAPTAMAINAVSVSGVAGNASLQRSGQKLRHDYPGLAGVYDVMLDEHVTQIFGIFKKDCIELSARGFKLAPKQ